MRAILHRFVLFAILLTLIGCASGSALYQASVPSNRLAVVDGDMPGPQLPPLETRQIVRSVSAQGVLSLASGERLALAGVQCDVRMIEYMQALFFGNEPDTLVYLPGGYVADGVRYAYVWNISLWELGDPDLEFAPATNSLNESGLSSGWCQPVEQDSHRFHSRYLAISRLYQ